MEAMPHLVEVHRAMAGDGLVVAAVSQEARSTVAAVAERLRLPFAVGAECRSFAAWGVRTIPRAFLLDRHGRVVWSGHPLDRRWPDLARRLLAEG